jgi:cell division protein FtsL
VSSATRALPLRRGLVRPTGARRHLLRVVRGWIVRRVLVLGGILVALCLLDVWLRLQVMHVGYDLSAARQMQLRLEHEQRELELELAMLRDPGRIGDVARHRLGMVDPAKGQVVVLP